MACPSLRLSFLATCHDSACAARGKLELHARQATTASRAQLGCPRYDGLDMKEEEEEEEEE
jgi:hypothetical protein